MKLVLLLASLFSSCAFAVPARMQANDRLEGYHRAAWQMACEATKYDCTTMKAPWVGYAVLGRSTLGMYPFGSRIILINIDLVLKDSSVPVMTHEFIHAIQNAQGRMNITTMLEACALEREAFTLTLQMAEKYDLDTSAGGTVPWYVIASQYGCPAN